MGDKEDLEELEEYEQDVEEELEDLNADSIEDDMDLKEDLMEDEEAQPGVPQQDPYFDRMKFLTEVRDQPETVRTSYLTKEELGVPLFSVRFWLNLELIAAQKGYELLKLFLHNKTLATTHSGLSREGFLLNTAITKRRESARNRTKSIQEVKNDRR